MPGGARENVGVERRETKCLDVGLAGRLLDKRQVGPVLVVAKVVAQDDERRQLE